MSQRFFIDEPIDRDRATLVDSEAHHLLHVMRAKAGDEVTLFDGSGREFLARISKLGRSSVDLAILEGAEVDRELPRSVTLGVSLPKGDRQKWLVEKATELGVAKIVPLVTERGVAQPVDQTLCKLRRAVIEASKQCRRNRLMEIGEPKKWEAFVAEESTRARLVAHPGGRTLADWQTLAGSASGGTPIVAAIGPEGGFTDREVALALELGWQAIDLGARILRVETAALLLAGLAAQ